MLVALALTLGLVLEAAPVPVPVPVPVPIPIPTPEAGTTTTATAAQVPIPTLEVAVRGRRRRAPTTWTIEAREARRVPGTQGDPVKVLESLPGVVRPPLGEGAVSIWGAAPEETRVFVDGVELPGLFHLGGLRSLIPEPLVERVGLVPAGQGAAYGRGLGGVVEVDTRRPTREPTTGLHGMLAVDPLDVAAYGSAPIAVGESTGQVSAAGRFSLIDRLVPALTDRDVGAVWPLPAYRDATLSAGLRLGARETVDVLALYADDELDRVVDAASALDRRAETLGQRLWMVRGRWRRASADEETSVVPSLTWSRRRRASALGDTLADESVEALQVGLRAEQLITLSPAARLSVGVDALARLGDLTRRGALTIPPREGDPRIFGRTPSDASADDAWSVATLGLAPHVSAQLEWGPLRVTPGLRLELIGLDVDRVTPVVGETPAVGARTLTPRPSPRLAAELRVGESWAVRAAGGLYAQPPDPQDLSAVFGGPRAGVADGLHGTAAVSWAPGLGLEVELAGYARRASGLVARSEAPVVRLAEVLTAEGEGRAAGAQLTVRRAPPMGGGVFGWVSYGLGVAERRASPTAAWRPADFDRRHLLTAVVGWSDGAWSVSLRARAASGAPYTAVVGRYEDARRDRVVPLLGPINGARLPAFVQLDLRAERGFAFEAARVSLSLEVLNLTAHANVEQLAYRADYLEAAPVLGLPLLALAGLRVER